MEREENFQPKVGQLFASVSKGSPLEHVKVEIGENKVKISRHDMVYEDILATKDIVDQRTVELVRVDESLGIAIQGGVDFKLPISIDTIFDNTPASRSGVINKDDILLEVNGKVVWGKTHEQAVNLLKSAGEEVTLKVATLRDKEDLQGGHSDGAEKDYWIPFLSVPLKLATVSPYAHSTAMLRPNSFQLMSCDEKLKVTLHCDERQRGKTEEWMTDIRQRTSQLHCEEMNKLNDEREDEDKLILMDWVNELLSSTPHTKVWKRKYLVLKKTELQIYDTYPSDIHEWMRPSHTHKLTEISTRILKPHELENQRANSALISSGKGYTHIISFETRQSIREWSQTIHQLTVTQIILIEAMQFPGQWKKKDIDFCIDLKQGFVVRDRNTKVVKWKKPFSWLRNSSDDNHTWLRLVFSKPHVQHTETQEIELEDLHLAVIAIECFMVAKVTTLDPNYIAQTDYIAEPSP